MGREGMNTGEKEEGTERKETNAEKKNNQRKMENELPKDFIASAKKRLNGHPILSSPLCNSILSLPPGPTTLIVL